MQTTHHLSQFHWSTFSCLFSNPHLPFFSSSSWVFIILILPCITIHLYHEIMDLFRICNSPQGLIRHLLCKSKNTSNTNHIEQKNNPIAIASTNLAHHTRTASKPNQPNPTCNRYWLSQPKNQPSYAKSSSRLILPSLSTSFFFFFVLLLFICAASLHQLSSLVHSTPFFCVRLSFCPRTPTTPTQTIQIQPKPRYICTYPCLAVSPPVCSIFT